MSKTSCDSRPVCLPSYLYNTEPLEPEDLPLQVALLTMELANMRTAQAQISRQLRTLAGRTAQVRHATALREAADLIEPKGWSDGTEP